MQTYAIQVDDRPVTEPRGPWRQRQVRRNIDYPDGTQPAAAADQTAADLGLREVDPADSDTDVRICVYRSLGAHEPDHELVFTGFRTSQDGSGVSDTGWNLGDLAAFVDWLATAEAQLLVDAGCTSTVRRRFAAAWTAQVAPALPDLIAPARRSGTPVWRYAYRRTGPVRHWWPPSVRYAGPAAGGRTGVPDRSDTVGRRRSGTPGAGTPPPASARRTGPGERPTVWTADGPPPGPQVVRIFDGVTYYRRTAADRWTPQGCPGPGFSWTEIPARLRVDASATYLADPTGALIMGPVSVDMDEPGRS